MTRHNNSLSERRRFFSLALSGALLAIAAGTQAMRGNRRKSAAISHEDVATFTRDFDVLLDSGLSLVEIFDTLAARQNNPSFRVAIRQIQVEIAQGGTLSSAMAKHPAVFDASYIALIQQGENEGALEEAVQQLARR